MHEIDIALFRNILEQASIVHKMQGIPSHMGDLQPLCCRDPSDLSGEKTKSRYAGSLFAAFKKELKPQADAEKRSALVYDFPDYGDQAEGMQFFHAVPEAPYSRQDHLLRRKKELFVSCGYGFMSQKLQRLFYTPDVSRIIIDQCYHAFLHLFSYMFISELSINNLRNCPQDFQSPAVALNSMG